MSLPKGTSSKKSIIVMTGGEGGCFGEIIHCMETIRKRPLCINTNDDVNIFIGILSVFRISRIT